MINETEPKIFLVCEKCGKKLIERKPNGLFHFIFGKKKDGNGRLYEFCPVEIMIHGSIRMRCIARECGYWNVFNYFSFEDKINRNANNQSLETNKTF